MRRGEPSSAGAAPTGGSVGAAGIEVERYPARAGAAVALVFGALAVAAVADAEGQLVAIAGELLALIALSVGAWRYHDGDRLVGVPLVAAGSVGAAAAIGYGVASATQVTQQVELLPGAVGLGLLALAGLPVRSRWSRLLGAAGAGAVVVAVVASGVVRGAAELRLLVGLALAVLAWDAAEQAINLGEQVGRRGGGLGVVATHSAWSVGVGVVGVAAASAVSTVGVGGLSLVGVGLLLAAAVALAAAAFT